MKFYLVITGLVFLAIIIFSLFIGVLVVGGHLIGSALGNRELDSTDAKTRRDALGRIVWAGGAFLALCSAFIYLRDVLQHLVDVLLRFLAS